MSTLKLHKKLLFHICKIKNTNSKTAGVKDNFLIQSLHLFFVTGVPEKNWFCSI